MKAPNAFWIGLVCAVGGCTQLLDLDQEYRPGQTGSAGMAGFNGMGGSAGAGGGSPCVLDTDCPPAANSCVSSTCVNNACTTNTLPMGTTCTADGKIVCDGNGICGQCNEPSDCSMLPPDDECQTRTCNNHACKQMFAKAGTLLMTQVDGDCLQMTCDGAGKIKTQDANMDLPEDNNPCTKNTCNKGKPAFPFEPANTACGVNLKCNNMGQCIGCLVATDCTGIDDFCKVRTCTNGMCGFDFTPAGTDLPTGQTAGDCKVIECDSQGNIVTIANNADIPVDGKTCTKDVCTAGLPSNPFEPADTACGGGGVCDATGVCKLPNGATCMTGSTCTSGNCIEGYCCNTTCTQNCKACNVPSFEGTCSSVPAGYPDDTCPSPQSCDGSNGAAACVSKFPIGYACTLSTQCGSSLCVDGVCCNSTCTAACKSCNVAGSAGTCSNLPSGQKDGALCSGTNSCDGMGVCKKDYGQICAVAAECLSGMCVDGVCCNSTCTNACKACNVAGSLGICSNVPAGSDDTPMCIGTNSCDGNGSCKKDNGQTCLTTADCSSGFCIDGVCCNGACLATCQACDVAGLVGTCVNVPSGQEDPIATTACTGVDSCNGAGACLLDNGQPCSDKAECVSNNCTGMPMTCQ